MTVVEPELGGVDYHRPEVRCAEHRQKNKQDAHLFVAILMEPEQPDLDAAKAAYLKYDPSGAGEISKVQMRFALQAAAKKGGFPESKITEAVEEVKEDSVPLQSFLSIFQKKGINVSSQEFRTRAGKALVQAHHTMEGARHSYDQEEARAFSMHVNNHLGGDPELSYLLPLNPEGLGLFDACTDGVLLCKLINVAIPGTIFEKAINMKRPLNIFQIKENLNLAINAAKSIGCKIISIFPESIMEKKEHLVLGMVWQVVKKHVLAAINLKQHPELVKLVHEGEELSDLLKLPPEELLLRWINYHLRRANSTRTVTNFANDLQDSECYTLLLNQIDSRCDLSALQETDMTVRAQAVVRNAGLLGASENTIDPRDIVRGNPKLNLLFCAEIFNVNPGLMATEQELMQAAQLLDDDVEGTREERAFRMWINSLNLEDLYINNLYEDLKTGVVLLRVLDHVDPSSVNWKQCDKKPKNRFACIGNCNKVIEVGRALGFQLVGVGGVDLSEAKRKFVLAYVWQLVRRATLKLLRDSTEEELLRWANGRVTRLQITSFRDPALKSGCFLLDLYASIEPRALNPEIVTPGETPEEKEQNAKYVLSVARKLGASVFCVWEDICEAKPKMILTLIAAAAQLSTLHS